MNIKEVFQQFEGGNECGFLVESDIDALTSLCELVATSKDDEKSHRLYQNCLLDLENSLTDKVRNANLDDEELDVLIGTFESIKAVMIGMFGTEIEDSTLIFSSFQKILRGAKKNNGDS